MATSGKLSLKGLEAWLEELAQAGKDVDAVADEMLIAGGDVLLDGMQARVPKDTHNLADHLERSQPMVSGNLHEVRVGIRQGADADTARYGNAQEYGTSSMAAQPYIRPTMDEDKGKARSAMKKIYQGYLESGK